MSHEIEQMIVPFEPRILEKKAEQTHHSHTHFLVEVPGDEKKN